MGKLEIVIWSAEVHKTGSRELTAVATSGVSVCGCFHISGTLQSCKRRIIYWCSWETKPTNENRASECIPHYSRIISLFHPLSVFLVLPFYLHVNVLLVERFAASTQLSSVAVETATSPRLKPLYFPEKIKKEKKT